VKLRGLYKDPVSHCVDTQANIDSTRVINRITAEQPANLRTLRIYNAKNSASVRLSPVTPVVPEDFFLRFSFSFNNLSLSLIAIFISYSFYNLVFSYWRAWFSRPCIFWLSSNYN